MDNKDSKPPERIYLQCYDKYDGSLLDFTFDDVSHSIDKINDNDAVYVLETYEGCIRECLEIAMTAMQECEGRHVYKAEAKIKQLLAQFEPVKET